MKAKKNMKLFFIVSLPRSRSTWLSHLLTTDVSHCFHELVSYSDINAIRAMEAINKPFVGSAETNPIKFLKGKFWFNAPIVIVERPVDEVKQSILKSFEIPAGVTNHDFEAILDRILAIGQNCMDTLKKKADTLVFTYNSLNSDKSISRIWQHCLPGVPLFPWRLAHFQDTIITVKNRDISRHLAGILRSGFRFKAERDAQPKGYTNFFD